MPRIDIDQLTNDYLPRIHRAALVLTGNAWDADDLAQETFLVASRQLDRFRGQSNPFTWLYGILLNLERQQRRRDATRRRKLQVLGDEESSRPTAGPAADMPIQAAEWKQSLWSRVHELPDGQRQTLVLRFSENLRYEEIADVLQCPLGTVKSRIYHGLLALRQRLESEPNDLRELPAFPNEDQNYAI
ncbi:MAG: sigma-70 family RNA polymerase sigma factor [Planctomycetales bacterium]|nr:sigma-70 family RNA polymerase sigma factor [Planctomycetales bacterium]MCA9219655.1 sigma-70 family RNA polymerase sigma factor [Planctomycetales bacterium]MCA9225785.1 sigma-70 family RNA polymerase sigma factor [Planctomycetales bacterium]